MREISRTILLSAALSCAASHAEADPVGWAQPHGAGTPIVITYSYSNLLDGTFLLLDSGQLRAASEESLLLWASYVPLNFVEVRDSGPPPGDGQYPASTSPQIRIGQHPMTDVAHAFGPRIGGGLAGDVHLDAGGPWALEAGPWNILEALTHEMGHALGLDHITEGEAIMNPSYPQARFAGLGSGFLHPLDIAQIRGLYGAGVGSVTPLDPAPEPGTVLLVGVGLGVMGRLRRRRKA